MTIRHGQLSPPQLKILLLLLLLLEQPAQHRMLLFLTLSVLAQYSNDLTRKEKTGDFGVLGTQHLLEQSRI